MKKHTQICLFLILSIPFFLSACSVQPPVEKETVQQATVPVSQSVDEGEVKPDAVAEPREANVSSDESGPEVQPATSEVTDLQAAEGFRVAKATARASGGELQLLLPADWTDTPIRSRMRLLQVALPASAGGAGEGEMTVFYFGPSAGTIQMNIDRWIGQFSQPDGSPSKDRAKIEEMDGDHHPLTIVDLSGTMAASTMPGMEEEPEREGWRLLASIVKTPSGPWFIKATGTEGNHGLLPRSVHQNVQERPVRFALRKGCTAFPEIHSSRYFP